MAPRTLVLLPHLYTDTTSSDHDRPRHTINSVVALRTDATDIQKLSDKVNSRTVIILPGGMVDG